MARNWMAKKTNTKSRRGLYTIPGTTEVIFSDEWKNVKKKKRVNEDGVEYTYYE